MALEKKFESSVSKATGKRALGFVWTSETSNPTKSNTLSLARSQPLQNYTFQSLSGSTTSDVQTVNQWGPLLFKPPWDLKWESHQKENLIA